MIFSEIPENFQKFHDELKIEACISEMEKHQQIYEAALISCFPFNPQERSTDEIIYHE